MKIILLKEACVLTQALEKYWCFESFRKLVFEIKLISKLLELYYWQPDMCLE